MVFSTEPNGTVVATVASSIHQSLVHGGVLWLVSGGSTIASQVAIMEILNKDCPELIAKLVILPIDERFGLAAHTDSNTEQMRQAGFFPYGARWIDVLSNNLNFQATIINFGKLFEDEVLRADTVIATMGLGTDGHTAGILPDSVAVRDNTSVVVGYKGSDYVRMTLGLASLRRISKAYVFAYSESKRGALNRLRANQEPLSSLPAKVLYTFPSVTVYNECITSKE